MSMPLPDILDVPVFSIEPPEFKPAIPDILMKDLVGVEYNRWLASELSVMSQKHDWLIRQVCHLEKVTFAHHLQLVKWKQRVESPFIAVAAVVAWFVPMWAPRLFIWLFP